MKSEYLKQIIANFIILIILFLPHAQALSISNVNIDEITSNSARITWNTDNASNSIVRYGDTQQILESEEKTESVVNHSVTISGLSKDTKYYYSVRSGEIFDNNAGSLYTFRTSEEEIVSEDVSENVSVNETTTDNVTYVYEGTPAISLETIPEFTRERDFLIKGTTNPNVVLRFYINDHKIPEQIAGTERFSVKSGVDGKFNATIRLLSGFYNSTLGLNIIKVEATTADYFRNYAYQTIVYDAVPPRLTVNTIPLTSNQGSITVKGSTNEATKIEIVVNNATQSTVETGENNIFETTATLSTGINQLEVIAIDKANHTAVHRQTVTLDNTPPSIVFEELDETYHFTIATIKGNTSEGNVKIKVTNTGSARIDYGDPSGVSRVRATYNTTNVTTIRYGRQENVTVGADIDVLGSIIGYEKETTSGENGAFTIRVGLINGTNNLLFELEDAAGNKAIVEQTLQMEASTGLWKIGRITTLPNEVYTDNLGNGNVDIGLTYDLFYLGSQAEDLNSLRIAATLDGSRLNNELFRVSDKPYVYWNPDQNKAVVYQEIQMIKYTGNPQELPDQADFGMQNRITYRIGREAEYDEKLFYDSGVSVEKPLKYSRFLTPEMINKSLERLNKTIAILEKALEIAEIGTYVSLGACLAMTVYTYVAGAGDSPLPSGGQLEKLFLACDRLLCPTVPPKCTDTTFSDDEYKGNGVYEKQLMEGNEVVGTVVVQHSVNQPQGCPQAPPNYAYVKVTTTGSADTQLFGQQFPGANNSPSWYQTTPIRLQQGTVTSINSNCFYTDVRNQSAFEPQLAKAGCYTPENPFYDNTKCLWNFKKGNNPTMTDLNPYDDIITSVRCGCVTGIRGNLENIIGILEGIRGCLQQAQIGEVRGGYCERLVAQFACDWISWLVKQVVNADWQGIIKSKASSEYIGNVQQRIGEVNSNLQARYGAIAASRVGLSADQLFNKACIAAITGDWTDLQNLLRESTRIPVKPVIGPMLPESRVTAYNPFTGTISINYLLTIGVMSGGQEVSGKVEIWCDPNYPTPDGMPVMCPDRRIKLGDRGVYVPRDGAVSENWAYQTDDIPYWGNVAIMTLDYQVGGEQKHEEKVEPIVRKGGLIGQCHWQIFPPVIVCESIVPGAEALLEAEQIRKSPDVRTYYPGNVLGVRIDARRVGAITNRTNDLEKVAVVYEMTIPGTGQDGQARTVDNKNNLNAYKPFASLKGKVDDTVFVSLHEFPSEAQVQYETKQILARRIAYPSRLIEKDEEIIVRAFTTGTQTTAQTPRNVLRVLTDGLNDNKWTEDGVALRYRADANVTLGNITLVEIEADAEQTQSLTIEIEADGVRTPVQVGFAAGESKTVTEYPASSNYKLAVTLWEDTDNNNAIDPSQDKLVLYRGYNQSERFTFGFNPEPACGITPRVEILKPRNDELFCKGELELAYWDDCNQIDQVGLFYDKANETNKIQLPSPARSEAGYRQYLDVDLSGLGFENNQEVELIVRVEDNRNKVATNKQTISFSSNRCVSAGGSVDTSEE